MTPRFKRARRKKLKFQISCKSVHKQRSLELAVSRITNKRTNKTQKRPRRSKELAERSVSSEFHANRSINKEMAADSASCVQDNKQTNKQNSKTTPRFKRARRKKLKFRISCKSEHKQRNGSRFS